MEMSDLSILPHLPQLMGAWHDLIEILSNLFFPLQLSSLLIQKFKITIFLVFQSGCNPHIRTDL